MNDTRMVVVGHSILFESIINVITLKIQMT